MGPEHGTGRGGHWEQGGTLCRPINAPTGSLMGRLGGIVGDINGALL